MATSFGPVELYALEFPDDRIPDAVKTELLRLVDADQVRILDLVVLRRPQDGSVEVIELEQVADELELVGIGLAAPGLTGEEDIDHVAANLAPGSSALVVVVENVWMRGIVGAIRDSGGIVLAAERIPAEVVNALAEIDDADDVAALTD
jgi:uncharacterized membrane protein